MRAFLGTIAMFSLLAACGAPEENLKSGVPGDDKGGLSLSQINEARRLMGELGDFMYARNTMLYPKSEIQTSQETKRLPQRKALIRRLQLERCVEKQDGFIGGEQYFKSYFGDNCQFNLKFLLDREYRSPTEGVKTERVESNLEFEVTNKAARLNIQEVDIENLFDENRTQGAEIVSLDRGLVVSMKVTTRSSGIVEYRLREHWKRTNTLVGSNKGEEIYTREDEFKLEGKYTVTMYKEFTRGRDGRVQVSYFRNGVKLTEKEYLEMLQDFDAQISMQEYIESIEDFPGVVH